MSLSLVVKPPTSKIGIWGPNSSLPILGLITTIKLTQRTSGTGTTIQGKFFQLMAVSPTVFALRSIAHSVLAERTLVLSGYIRGEARYRGSYACGRRYLAEHELV